MTYLLTYLLTHGFNVISSKIVKDKQDIFSNFITRGFNSGISTSRFPNTLKNPEVKHVFQNNSKTNKTNYRPASLSPVISKVCERLIYKQLSEYFEPILSKYQCDSWKDHSTQHCLLVMVEKWKKCLDKKWTRGTLLTDLSKALAKLNAYGFDELSLKYVNNYPWSKTKS